MKNVGKYLLKFIKSKYTISFVLLVAWLLIFDKNDLRSQIQLTRKLNELKAEKEYYLSEIQKNGQYMNELKTNPQNLEKFAREKYLMKRDNEDVFVIVTDSVSK